MKQPKCKHCAQPFDDYKMFVQKFGAEHGVQIPDPNEESDDTRNA